MKIIKIGETEPEIFNKEIKDRPAFVKFYMPGCIHCENLKPTWIDLENEMESDERDLSIIDVHSNALSGINSNITNNVQGFPTIMMIYNNGVSFKMYEGDRSLEDMKKFIDDFLNGKMTMSGGKHRNRNKIKSKRYKSSSRTISKKYRHKKTKSKTKSKRKYKRKYSKRKHSKLKNSKRK